MSIGRWLWVALLLLVATGLEGYKLDLPFFTVDGRLWVYGQVAEVEGYFLLDTGANLVLLTKLPKSRMVDPNAKAVEVQLGGVTKTEPLYLLDQITINGHVLKGDFRYAESPTPVLSQGAQVPIVGILGLGMFNQGFVRILNSSSCLQFTNLDSLAGRWVSAARSGGHLVVPVEVGNGHLVDLILDSGAPRTILPESALTPGVLEQRRLTGQTMTPSQYHATSDLFHEVFFDLFSAFDAEPTKGIVLTSDCGLLGGQVGTLGNDYLRFFDLTIDYAGDRIKAVPAKPFSIDDRPFANRIDGFGLGSIGRTPQGDLLVTELYLDTPFSGAGFRLGDVLETIGNRSSRALSLNEIRILLQQPQVLLGAKTRKVSFEFRHQNLLGEPPN